MQNIHESACIHPTAQLGSGVSIGPFCVVENDVTIGDGCRLDAHVVVKSGTRLGQQNQIGVAAVLGSEPQHVRCPKEIGGLEIGDGNQIREYVTIHRAMNVSNSTKIGNENMIMVGSHVGHDCEIGDRVIIANNVMLAGHVQVAERAYISGAVGVHQFCRIGSCAMVGGQARITKDVPPFVMVDGETSRVVGLNSVGVRRAGFDSASMLQMKSAYRIAYRSDLSWDQTLVRLKSEFHDGVGHEFYCFLAASTRGCLPERRRPIQHSKSNSTQEVRATGLRLHAA